MNRGRLKKMNDNKRIIIHEAYSAGGFLRRSLAELIIMAEGVSNANRLQIRSKYPDEDRR